MSMRLRALQSQKPLFLKLQNEVILFLPANTKSLFYQLILPADTIILHVMKFLPYFVEFVKKVQKKKKTVSPINPSSFYGLQNYNATARTLHLIGEVNHFFPAMTGKSLLIHYLLTSSAATAPKLK